MPNFYVTPVSVDNSASLGGNASSYYYVASAITTASVAYATSASSAASATWAVNAGSANYAINAANSSTTSQVDFTTLTLSGSNVATQAYVTSLGYQTISGSVAFANTAASLNSIAASSYARLDQTNTFTSSMNISGSLSVTGNVVYNQATNSQTGSAYTLALADSGKFVEMTSSAANTITVPASATTAWQVGSRIDVVQYGAGTTTISPAANVTINYYSPTSAATRTIKARYGAATLIYRAANEWLLVGNLT